LSTTVSDWTGAEAFGTVFPGHTLFPALGIFMTIVIGWLLFLGLIYWQMKDERKVGKETLEKFEAGEFDRILAELFPAEKEAEKEKPKAEKK